ncbi:MAG: hypothetical protein ACRD40_10925 [Candidatus Acidiferrales bacterium]
MSSGFNTDVNRGGRVFHVQTEDRGPQHPSIDTVVYRNGYILHRHSWDYSEVAGKADFSPDDLRQRVEAQHRSVIEALRDGNLDAEIAAAEEQAVRAVGIQVQLLNPTSWLAAGKVSLEIGIIRRVDRKPVSGANIQASIAGALNDASHRATSDDHGVATIHFDLPPLGKGDLALVIEAQSDALKDEIRFSMRSRPKTAETEPAP